MKQVVLNVEMEDGTLHENLRAKAKDFNRTEEVMRRLKWGSYDESPFRFQSFLAYAVMTRTGLYDATKGFDAFEDDCAMVEMSDDGEVNPTQ